AKLSGEMAVIASNVVDRDQTGEVFPCSIDSFGSTTEVDRDCSPRESKVRVRLSLTMMYCDTEPLVEVDGPVDVSARKDRDHRLVGRLRRQLVHVPGGLLAAHSRSLHAYFTASSTVYKRSLMMPKRTEVDEL